MLRSLTKIALAIVLALLNLWVSHNLHSWGRTSRVAYEVNMAIDLMAFQANSGGYFGASENYFGWVYAKATTDPDRPLWHKLLFWPNPYYITPPPDQWPYEHQGSRP